MEKVCALVAAVVAATLAAGPGPAAGPKFYPDDPIQRDPETQDASATRTWEVSGQFDLVENSFLGAGESADRRAANVNTVDDVPDSSWFTNRAGARPMTMAEFVRGPDTGNGPAPGTWTVLSKKTEGVTPGFTMTDSAGDIYWIKFDPKSNPEMASGAEVVATKFFHAFGYHVPENYLAILRPDSLVVGPGATIEDEDGRRRSMTREDVDDILERAARRADGTYRVLASRNLTGRPIGAFRYYGTRPDDPNDIFPHEHRRELRGLSVFSAWLNHDEVRSTNSLDTIVDVGARRVVRHHLLDFGSTLGSGSVRAQSRRAGNEFVWESRPTLITMLTLGLYVRPWIKVEYADIPSVGRIEAVYFRPEQWKPDYPNPAFRNTRADDRFWAARIVAAFSDEAVRALIATAQFSDPQATQYLTDTVLARKSKVLKAWLNETCPVVNLRLGADGTLTFENAAEQAGVAKAAERYTLSWAPFDNRAGTETGPAEEQTVTGTTARAPAALIAARHEYIAVRIGAVHPEHAAWARPATVHFRRTGDEWSVVGLERAP